MANILIDNIFFKKMANTGVLAPGWQAHPPPVTVGRRSGRERGGGGGCCGSPSPPPGTMGEALLPPQAAQPGTTASAPRGGWPRSLAAGLSLAALVPLLLGLGPGVSTGAAGSGAVHLYHLTQGVI